MPVIVPPEDRQDWLAGEGIPLVSFAGARMTAIVNNSRHEGEECIASPA